MDKLSHLLVGNESLESIAVLNIPRERAIEWSGMLMWFQLELATFLRWCYPYFTAA